MFRYPAAAEERCYSMRNDRQTMHSAEFLVTQALQVTHKSGLQIPAPAVVEKTNKHGSEEVTNQQRDVGCHGIRYDKPNKLLQIKKAHVMSTFNLCCCIQLHWPSTSAPSVQTANKWHAVLQSYLSASKPSSQEKYFFPHLLQRLCRV